VNAYITATRPKDVALDVEEARRRGCPSFTLRSVDHGGMLDLERLGAARYAAGLQAVVELEVAVAAHRR
jgi:L-alanine-DL-glutamate epimerase-like enolase superfamily enzyme